MSLIPVDDSAVQPAEMAVAQVTEVGLTTGSLPGETPAQARERRSRFVPKIEDRPMSLVSHLNELRGRLFWCVFYYSIAVIVAYNAVPKMLAFCRPMLGPHKLIFTHPTEAFFAYFNAAMVMGACLASPILLYHVLMFILPGLERHERRWVLRLLPLSIFQFLLGAVFALKVVLPITMNFFMSFATPELVPQLKIGDFVGFVVMVTTICGIIFELPIVMLFLAGMNLVSSKFLARHRRMAYFLSFVIAAVATPTPDAVTATVVALPILLNFEGSIWLIRLFGK